MTKLISIVIPVYNAAGYIERCLNSILNQSYQNFEVLLIDDGSIDESLKKLREYEEKDERFKTFTQTNSGPSAARNKGIDEAKGDYLIFVDIDDYVDENYLLNNFKVMKEKTIVCSNNLEIWKNKVEERRIFENESKEITKQEMLKVILSGKAGLVCSKLIDLNLIKNNKIYFDKKVNLFEDQLFFLEVALKSENFFYLNENLYYYDRRNENSITIGHKKKFFENMIYIFQKIEKILSENNIFTEFKEYSEIGKKDIINFFISNEMETINLKNYKERKKNIEKLKEINTFVSFEKLFIKYKIIKIKNILRGILWSL